MVSNFTGSQHTESCSQNWQFEAGKYVSASVVEYNGSEN